MSSQPVPGGPVRTVEAGTVDEEQFRRVLRDAVDRLEAADVPHVLMGGLAVAALGRPRWTHDIDVFLRPDDARRALQVLADAGYDTERTDPLWLFKAERDGVPVDLIFRSEGNFYLDDEMLERAVETTLRGERIRVLPPEDLIVIKASAHGEEGGYHWFDALALLVRPDLDWPYLLRRARRAVRRVLALLVYAGSEDIVVPRGAVRTLSELVYGDDHTEPAPAGRLGERRTYEAELLREQLRRDPRVSDLDVAVHVHGDTLLLTGEVATEERRDALSQAAAELAPGLRIDNRANVTRIAGATHVEEVG